MVGPPLATFLATSIAPAAGVLVAGAILLFGGWVFTAQRSTEPPPSPGARASGPFGVLSPAVIAVSSVFFCCGTVFGSVEVVAVAFADEAGRRGLAGALLAALAFGSLVAGLTFGVMSFRRSVGGQFVIAACAFGVLMQLLLLAPGLWQLAVLMVVSGVAIAPLLITATMLIERLVPPSALTEGLTWTVTALVCGVTLGASLGGHLVDLGGARQGFWLSSAAGVAAALTAVLASPLLRHAAVERAAGRSAPRDGSTV